MDETTMRQPCTRCWYVNVVVLFILRTYGEHAQGRPSQTSSRVDCAHRISRRVFDCEAADSHPEKITILTSDVSLSMHKTK